MDYEVRLATEKDVNKLSILKQKVWSETYRGIYSDEKIDNFDYIKNENSFKSIILNPQISLYVVTKDDKLIGYMSCGAPRYPYKDYKQEIGLLYLLKEYQRNKIGSKLFNMAYNKIKED